MKHAIRNIVWATLLLSFVVAAAPRQAPAWKLKTPDGQWVTFPADAKQQPTVLLFWPSWCPYSRALQPYVQDIWVDYRDVGVKVWTINILEDADPVQAMQERGLSFPLLLDGDPLRDTYDITRTPWLVVIDGHNKIVYTRPSDPPTPIDVAKDVRKTLNGLLGDKAVPLPERYPPPYDLHLKNPAEMVDRSSPVTVPQSEWEPWVIQYLAGIGPDEGVKDIPARGPVQDGKTALAAAKEIWTQAYGADTVRAQAPYRSYRKDNRWVVLGAGLDARLGTGLIVVIEAGSGKVLRMSRGGEDKAK